MSISELIVKLIDFREEYGDLQIFIQQPVDRICRPIEFIDDNKWIIPSGTPPSVALLCYQSCTSHR